jgi:hypothetical protein
MIQHKEIGKYKPKQSIIDAKIGGIYVTPKNRRYSLISAEKVGKTRTFVYEWITDIELKVSNTKRLQSKHEVAPNVIDNFIDSLIAQETEIINQ